jgi:hypothetical protein
MTRLSHYARIGYGGLGESPGEEYSQDQGCHMVQSLGSVPTEDWARQVDNGTMIHPHSLLI